jgi:hypothetical protein
MALDDAKRKPLSAAHLTALDGLERGVTFNTAHTVARELIEMGYAFSDWGRLAITEAGRIALRRPLQSFRIIDEHVADLSDEQFFSEGVRAIDPMTAPHLVHSSQSKMERTAIVLVEEEPYAPLPPADDDVQRAMRAAGVASGVTGVWPETEWVHAFIDAFINNAPPKLTP